MLPEGEIGVRPASLGVALPVELLAKARPRPHALGLKRLDRADVQRERGDVVERAGREDDKAVGVANDHVVAPDANLADARKLTFA